MNWTPIAEFFIKGEPRPMPRATRGKDGRYRYRPGPWEEWQQRVLLMAKRHAPRKKLAGPVYVGISNYFTRPKKYSGPNFPDTAMRMITTPDRDNLDKLILDAMTKLGFWEDDCQVCDGYNRKFYAGVGDPTGALVTVMVDLEWPYEIKPAPHYIKEF